MQPLSDNFWLLVSVWMLVLILGAVNWQAAFAAATGRPGPCGVVGLVGPSTLLIEAPQLPRPGSLVRLRAQDLVTEAFVTSRIARDADVWGELHLLDSAPSEQFLRGRSVTIEAVSDATDVIGAVAAGSTHMVIHFYPTRTLEIGQVVSVSGPSGSVLYRVQAASIERATVKGGAQLVVESRAAHLGTFDPNLTRLLRYRWVPEPGSAVRLTSTPTLNARVPDSWLKLGNLHGT